MIYIPLVLLLFILVALIFVSYKTPQVTQRKNMSFTRTCMLFGFFCFGVSSVSLNFRLYDPEIYMLVSNFSLIACWLTVLLTLRGLFEVLKDRAILLQAR